MTRYVSIIQNQDIELDKNFLTLENESSQKSQNSEIEENALIKSDLNLEENQPSEQPNEQTKCEYTPERRKLAKLLFFHENKTLYLKCKLYYASITLLCRLIFFVLLFVYDGVDSFISAIAIIFIAKNWRDSINDSKKSVMTVNKIIFLFMSFKYFLGVLDIEESRISGEKPEFNTSLMLAFLPKSNDYYLGFKQCINNSLSHYWLFFEGFVFIITQLLVLLYCAIL